jgi:hypothetical protein
MARQARALHVTAGRVSATTLKFSVPRRGYRFNADEIPYSGLLSNDIGGPISESATPVDRESCSYAGPYRISYPLSVTLPPPGDTIPKGALAQASGLSNFLGWFHASRFTLICLSSSTRFVGAISSPSWAA